MIATAIAPLNTQERLEMLNLIFRLTAPVTQARAKLQLRYGVQAMIEIPGAVSTQTQDVVLPPMAARIDADLVQLAARIRDTVLNEYGQLEREDDPEDEIVI